MSAASSATIHPVRYKPGKPRQIRLLCGKPNAQGVQNCRGELGRLLLKDEGGYVFATPLVLAAMAREPHSDWYRVRKQRRAFRSGVDGAQQVGGGVTAGRNLLHDAQGQPLKWLPPLYRPEHRLVLVCPRCQEPNEVGFAALVPLLQRLHYAAG